MAASNEQKTSHLLREKAVEIGQQPKKEICTSYQLPLWSCRKGICVDSFPQSVPPDTMTRFSFAVPPFLLHYCALPQYNTSYQLN